MSGGLQRVRTHPRRFAWPPELAELLGRVPDAQLARMAGVSHATVAAERRRRGIAPSAPRRPPVQWTAEMISLLGTDSDRVIAAELEVHVTSVSYKRQLLGIPAFHEPQQKTSSAFPWTPEQLALLGQEPDPAIAKRLRITTSCVCRKRRLLGIPPYQPQPRRIEWTAEMIGLLGTISDEDVAGRFGVSSESVRRKRADLEIPPWRAENGPIARVPEIAAFLNLPNAEALERGEIGLDTLMKLRREYGIRAPISRGVPWPPEALARLGAEPDTEIARDLGLDASTVQRKRRSLGIAAYQSRRRPLEWAEEALARLGKEPDAEIAKDLGVPASTVGKKRRRLGLPPPPGQLRRWASEELSILGTAADDVIAERLGRTAVAVAQRRRALEIPPWKEP